MTPEETQQFGETSGTDEAMAKVYEALVKTLGRGFHHTAKAVAEDVIIALRSLPVEQRMEAMGMAQVEQRGWHDELWFVGSGAELDYDTTIWVEDRRD